MTESQWGALTLLVIGAPVTAIFLANFDMPGNAALPGRLKSPVSYWGNVALFGGTAFVGLYGLAVGF
jgi:hypothetical protein